MRVPGQKFFVPAKDVRGHGPLLQQASKVKQKPQASPAAFAFLRQSHR